MRAVIIGTAGHIDHGKTSLVKALTGVDPDRLKEEKERGITIDLGFAYKPFGDGGMLGFVDVPGHEKLVRTMLAGAAGIDGVLLVVAADDGAMPQTREHLAILDLLGLRRGVVALTKRDSVSAERLGAAQAEVRSLLAGTGLADAPIFAVSSLTGEGIQALDDQLKQMALEQPPAAMRGHFRLAVDRSFTLPGIGTVVTGTAVAGSTATGERLLVSPQGLPVRVRGLHAQNRQAARGDAGQRLALNLAGVEKSQVHRGDWLVAEPAHAPTARLDVRLQLLASEAKALSHWASVRVHLGAAEVGARVALLEGSSIAAGASARVQLELDRPIAALRGDRFIARDPSAQRTLGGGVVIDAFAPPTRRHKQQRLAVLKALEAPAAETALAELLEIDLPGGVDLGWFATLWNLGPAEQEALTNAVAHRTLADGSLRLAFTPRQLAGFGARVTAALAQHHRRAPDSPGLTLEQLRRAVTDKPTAAVFALLVRGLANEGALLRAGPYLRLPNHEPALLANEQKLWEKMRPWLDEAALHPPRLADLLARDRSLHRDQVVNLMLKLARMGKVFAVSNDYFVLPTYMVELASRAQALAQADPHKRLNVKTLRETTGISRHLSVPLVEFFDRIGFTKRDEIGRHVRRDAREMFGGQPGQDPR